MSPVVKSNIIYEEAMRDAVANGAKNAVVSFGLVRDYPGSCGEHPACLGNNLNGVQTRAFTLVQYLEVRCVLARAEQTTGRTEI